MKSYSLILATSGLVFGLALSSFAMGKKTGTSEPSTHSEASAAASQGRVNSDPYTGGGREQGTGRVGTPMNTGSVSAPDASTSKATYNTTGSTTTPHRN